MEEKKTYTPQPVDTAAVQLPKELDALAEMIAKNVHEVWAEGRIRDGWTYGPERNDELRLTPCLVPYEELSEEEKTFDRNTAQETLKLIVKLGFNITNPSQHSDYEDKTAQSLPLVLGTAAP